MPRLIDADALKEDIEQQCALLRLMKDNDELNQISTVLESGFMAQIDKMPTIEERKKGKWIERNPQNSDKCRLIECDQCGFAHIVGFNVPYEHWIENRNFCERCGADMRKKGEK